MSKPITSIASQIAEALYIRDHAHEIRRNDTEGKLALSQQIIGDIARSLQFLSDNRDWIVAEHARRKQERAE